MVLPKVDWKTKLTPLTGGVITPSSKPMVVMLTPCISGPPFASVTTSSTRGFPPCDFHEFFTPSNILTNRYRKCCHICFFQGPSFLVSMYFLWGVINRYTLTRDLISTKSNQSHLADCSLFWYTSCTLEINIPWICVHQGTHCPWGISQMTSHKPRWIH